MTARRAAPIVGRATCCVFIAHSTCFAIPLKKACTSSVATQYSYRGSGEFRMKTLLAGLVTCAAVFSFSTSAGAASLVSIKGAVQINSGSGFHQVAQVAGSAELAPGNSVMVAAGASAEIRYSDDCRIPVRPGSVEVVARFSPCRPPPTVTAVQGGTLVGADPDTFVRSQILRDNRDPFY
jgi:hypothetical protein